MDRVRLIALVEQELAAASARLRPKVVLKAQQKTVLVEDPEELGDLALVVVEGEAEAAHPLVALGALPVGDRCVVATDVLLLRDGIGH